MASKPLAWNDLIAASVVPAGEVNIVSGLLQGIERGVGHAGPLLGILVPAAAISVVLGNLGQVGAVRRCPWGGGAR